MTRKQPHIDYKLDAVVKSLFNLRFQYYSSSNHATMRVALRRVQTVSRRSFATSSSSPTDELIIKRCSNGLAHITLNRPDRLNAITLEQTKAFSHFLHEHEKDCKAILVTGQGDKAFSVGGDIRQMLEGDCSNIKFNSDISIENYNTFLLFCFV